MTMADHPIDIIIRARDLASRSINNVNKSLSKMGGIASKGIRTAASNLAKLGAAGAAVGAGLLVLNVKSGIQSLATLESAVTSVDGAIKQMGLAGQVTGAQ